MKQFYVLFCLFITLNTYGQSPSITYNTPQIYSVGTPITPLKPANTGGSVPVGTYGLTSTLSGTSQPGFDNGTKETASYNKPRDVTVDRSGNIYVVDDNNVIRKITPNGIVTTFAGTGALGSANGIGTSATFGNPLGIITDADGNVYVSDSNNNMIRKITPSGIVTTFAGDGTTGAANGPGATASFNKPYGIGIDAAGNLYVTDAANNMIRKITPNGDVSTIAGDGFMGSADGPARTARFNYPEDVIVDATGNVYVTDSGNHKIRKISPDGIVTTLAGNGISGKDDGTGASATFYFPGGMTTDVAGNLYVADPYSQIIRKVTQSGVVTTIAGSSDRSYGHVDGIGRDARFFFPYGLGSDGVNLYIADSYNSDIRKISLSGYTISPNLPAGLVFDATTGEISGTPTSVSPATNYTVTAYNNYGSGTTIVNIAVTSIQSQTITFPPVQVKTYGDADFNLGATTTNPTIPLTYSSSDNTVATVSPSGMIHIVGAGSCTITAKQSGDSNYSAASPISHTLTINTAILTITADDKVRTYGDDNPAFTCTYSGFVLNENSLVLSKLPVGMWTTTAASNAGIYDINVYGAVAKNYTIRCNKGNLTINPAILIVTTYDKSKYYGEENPPFPLFYKGFVNNDDASQLTAKPVAATTATKTSPVGQYIISVNGGVSPNYSFIYNQGILTINPIVSANLISIPNTFTPNGDGINDSWEIKNIGAYERCTVDIFNRNGQKVYQSTGYVKSWDGTRGGSPLPVGVYYFTIKLNDGSNPISGHVTLMR